MGGFALPIPPLELPLSSSYVVLTPESPYFAEEGRSLDATEAKAGYIDNNFSFLKFSRQSISNSSIPNQNFNLSSQTGILHNCPSCLTIWYKLPDGTSKVLEQGCFLNQELCHGSQLCIQDENLKQHLSLKKSLSACCCTGSMCNREFLSNRNEASDLVVVFITSVVLGTISFMI